MNYTHDYEYAFYHFRPDYVCKGQRNPGRYTITGCYTNGDYFRIYAENRKQLVEWLNGLRDRSNVDPASIAVQNRIGQLLWTSETGDTGIAPKYMNGTLKDSEECFYIGFWKDCTSPF